MASNYHHGNLKQTLLTAAEKSIARDGIEKLSIRAIAREANVSPAAPYRHFKDRQNLLEALATKGFEDLQTAFIVAFEPNADNPKAALKATAAAYVGFALKRREIFRLMFGPMLATREPLDGLRIIAESAYLVLTEVVEEGLATGAFQPAPPADLAYTVWSTIHGLATLFSERLGDIGNDEDRLAQAERAIALLTDRIGTK